MLSQISYFERVQVQKEKVSPIPSLILHPNYFFQHYCVAGEFVLEKIKKYSKYPTFQYK